MDYLHEVAACKGERLLEGLREIAQELQLSLQLDCVGSCGTVPPGGTSRECWKGKVRVCLGAENGILAHPCSSSGVGARGSANGLVGSKR